MEGSRTHFDQMVLSGGGTRCYWQGGFLHVVEREIGLDRSLKRLSAVSGGALTACGHVAHIGERIVSKTVDVFERLKSNFDPASRDGGPSPHQEAYREIVEDCFDDEAVQAVAEGPEIEILLTALPEKVWDEITVSASFALYLLDRATRQSTTKKLTALAGVKELRVSARTAAAEGRLTDLILTAARIPPLFDVDRWDGTRVIDGGSIDDAPFPAEDKGNSLVLLASQFENVPVGEGRIFVTPAEAVPTKKIDFTAPGEIGDAWELGEKSGHAFLERWHAGPMDHAKAYRF